MFLKELKQNKDKTAEVTIELTEEEHLLIAEHGLMNLLRIGILATYGQLPIQNERLPEQEFPKGGTLQ